MLNLDEIKQDAYLKEFIFQSQRSIKAMKYPEHGLRHLEIVSTRARYISEAIGLSKKDQELNAIAAYCHDCGNFLSRSRHHYFGGFLFMHLFKDKFSPRELSLIMQGIMNHDKFEMKFSNPITAVVVLADKSDVHRDRMIMIKSKKLIETDIHARVNYATTKSDIKVDNKKKKIILELEIDSKFVPIMEYFEIFMNRMIYCRQSAKYLGYDFSLVINKFTLL